jgi:hypothetical protein
MRSYIAAFTALLAAGLLFFGSGAYAAEPGATYYVSQDGNDAWTGTLAAPNEFSSDGPFITLERAQDAVRALKLAGPLPAGGVKVVLRGGRYALKKTVEFTAEDAGTAEAPICFAAQPGEKVFLTGGVRVPAFEAVSDPAILERVSPEARAAIVQSDLKALGVADFGAPNDGGVELFFQDKPMTLSRWPNEGFVNIKELAVPDDHQIHGLKGSKTGKFIYDGDRPSRWIGEKDAWLHGYWFWDWSDQRQKIASIDPATSTIALAEPYHNYGYRKGQWYYAFNVLAELDTPGEWYLDREKGILYFWPPAAPGPEDVVVSVLPTLVTMKDTANLSLRGLVLETSRATAVTIGNSTGCRVEGCTIRNIGGNAVSVGGGANSGVAGCEIYALGKGGISIDGGDRATLAPAGLFADNNHIHHWGRWSRMYQSAVSMNGVGNRISHNLIHDAPHMAIQFGGNDHVIEFNEIHRVCTESNDAGAIYAGRNWTMRGNVIRNNFLHDISGFQNKGCVGVYLDDMFASAEITGNLFKNVTMAAFLGGGRDCSIVNNIFVDCNPAIHVDARALNWAAYHADEWVKEAAEKGTISGIAYNKPPYSDKYPKLVGIIEDEPKAPKGNIIARNICVGGKWDNIEEIARPFLAFENNLLDQDPLFVDAAAGDYHLKPESPALALGFQQIPLEQIGLQNDEARAAIPVRVE